MLASQQNWIPIDCFGSKRNPPISGLCQLRPAADIGVVLAGRFRLLSAAPLHISRERIENVCCLLTFTRSDSYRLGFSQCVGVCHGAPRAYWHACADNPHKSNPHSSALHLAKKPRVRLWRLPDAGPAPSRTTSVGRHPQPCTRADIASSYRASMPGSFHVLSNNGFSPLGVRVRFFQF